MSSDFLNQAIQFLWPGSFWALSLAVAVLLIPLERAFPRVPHQAFQKGRSFAIMVVAVSTLLIVFFYYHVLQSWLIDVGLVLKFASMSRWPIPDWLLLLISLLLLDFIHYALHWLAHIAPPLWRMHAVHHSDEHVTGLTTLLQHPGEILWSQIVHILIAVILGIPVLTYFYFGLIRAIHGVFTHVDFRLPSWCENSLRWLFVTPDMHRVHHSVDLREGNSNYGSILSIWDRMFGTLIVQPKKTGAAFEMGLPATEGLVPNSALSLLFHPFRRRK
jgi:sterol desaturase/sphingolipid hydroxylase (fatty acid hydroxylase superfamily)